MPDAAPPPAASHPAALAALTDPERVDPGWRSAEQVAAWLLRADERDRLAGAEQLRDQPADEHRFLYWRALGLARLGTAASAEEALAAVFHFGPPADPATAARVLVARSLPWLGDFAGRWLEAAPFDARPTIDQLVELGALVRPVGDRYASAMIAGLPVPCPAAHIRARLLTRPTAAGADLRALLTAPGAGARLHRLDWANRRRLDANTWTVQIADLVEEEVLDRAALVELCLDALDAASGHDSGSGPGADSGAGSAGRDEAQRAGETWFAGLYQRLEPTAADLEPHATRLRRLLDAPNPRLVELAQRSLQLLARAGKLTGREVLHCSAGPLARPERRVVLGQLRLLADVVASGPGIAPAAVRVAAAALDHSRPDVQIEALRFVTGHADAATLAELDLAARSPALRAAATALLAARGGALGSVLGGGSRPARPASVERCAARVAAVPVDVRRRFGLDLALAAVQAGRFPHVPPAPPGPGAPLRPGPEDDPVEVAALLARGMESDADPVLIQQALAAAVRSARQPLPARAAAWVPYRDATAAVRATVPFQHRFQPRRLMAELADCWSRGAALPETWLDPAAPGNRTVLTGPRTPQRLADVLAGQVAECTRLLARHPGRPLLAEPTHAAGAIDPDVLLDRLARLDDSAARSATGFPLDVELAALRLPRGLPRAFWEEATRRQPVVARSLQAHYAAQTEPPLRASVGLPAHRLGFRLGDGPRRAALASARPGLRPPGIWWALTDLDDVFALRPHRWRPEGAGALDTVVPHWPAVAPWHPELVAAHLLMPLALAQQPGGIAAPGAAAALDAPTGGLLGPIGHLALVEALQGVRAATRLAAAGTWQALVLDGRLDPGPAVAAMLLLHGGGLLRPARIVGALRTVVADPVVGYCTLQVLTAAAPPLFAERTPQLHLLLGLAEELAIRFGADAALEEVRRAADPRRESGRHRTGLPAVGPERPAAALAALDRALTRFETAG